MSRARAAGLSLALALLGAPAARGQEGPAPPPAAPPGPTIGLLGEVLRRAQEGGAIERLAGERWFRLQGKQGGDALLLVRVIPSAEPPRVVVDTVLTTLGQDPPADMNTQVLLGPDGRMQAFRSALRLAGRGESRAEGRVQQGELQLVVEQPGQDRREERKPWEADAVPGQALMFLVPALWEFIPQDELQLVQFDESAGKLAPWLLQRAQRPGRPGAAAGDRPPGAPGRAGAGAVRGPGRPAGQDRGGPPGAGHAARGRGRRGPAPPGRRARAPGGRRRGRPRLRPGPGAAPARPALNRQRRPWR